MYTLGTFTILIDRDRYREERERIPGDKQYGLNENKKTLNIRALWSLSDRTDP